MAFGLGPVLTMGAIEALDQHGTDALRQLSGELTTGEWTGTMKLTEPQAGSDLGALRTRAERAAMAPTHHRPEDLHHLWRARPRRQHHPFRARAPPDAPPGTRGISLFLVPKFSSMTTARSARATTRAAIRSSTSSAFTPRRPARWSTATRRRDRLAGRRGEPRAQLHVHDDEQGAPQGRPAGRGDAERATQQALAYASERQQGRAGGADRRRSSSIPTCGACC